jgi:hypothetical protein
VAGVKDGPRATASRAKGKHEDEIARLKADNERLRTEGGNLFTAKSSVDQHPQGSHRHGQFAQVCQLIKRGFELTIEL